MSSESFTISKKALITLVAASIVVIISLGIRQTFGLFYFDFNTEFLFFDLILNPNKPEAPE